MALAPNGVTIRRFPIETDRVRRLMNVFPMFVPRHIDAAWVALWGVGDPPRARVMEQVVKAGGRCLAMDLAYWHRYTHFRISIDAPHPQAWVMRRALPATRFAIDPPPVADVWNPKGPVIVAGIGGKAHIQYGNTTVFTWERAQVAACRELWPRPILYRRKTPTGPALTDLTPAPNLPIDQALKGASLVITWHSNVAVDAIRLGIPVVCRDGAAAAVCPSEVSADPQPLPHDLRMQFLHNLAWFQWSATELGAMWTFVQELVES